MYLTSKNCRRTLRKLSSTLEIAVKKSPIHRHNRHIPIAFTTTGVNARKRLIPERFVARMYFEFEDMIGLPLNGLM
jgi:hypothetical protein